jgi:predicted acetyltransferase
MLYGIPDFYTKFGYAVCLAAPTVKLRTRDAELAKSLAQPITTAPVTSADWPAITGLFNQRNAARTCSMVRSTETFKGFQMGSYWNIRAESVTLKDSHERFAGYAVWDQTAESVNVVELETVDDAIYPALLAEFARQAVEKRCGEITLNLPHDHPFAEFVQRYGCEWSIRHFRHSNGMGRILNQAGLFDKIMHALRTRVARSPMRDHSFVLKLHTDLGRTTLMFGAPGEESGGVLELTQDRLTQLVLGYRSAADVLNDPAVQAQSTHAGFREWLEVLFPRGHPHNWLPDYF